MEVVVQLALLTAAGLFLYALWRAVAKWLKWRHKHDFSDWNYYSRQASCDQTRICVTCGKSEFRTAAHNYNFSDWKYTSPTSCDQTCNCTRCGKAINKTAPHNFSDWKIAAPSTLSDSVSSVLETQKDFLSLEMIAELHRSGTRQCARCGELETYAEVNAIYESNAPTQASSSPIQ